MIASATSSQSGSSSTATSTLTTMSKVRLSAQSQPVRTGGRSSKSGTPWPGHVLAALDEELRRVGREPDLDALAVCLLDDLEHGALVEVRLGEDHLVGPHLLEDGRQLLARCRAAGARGTPSVDDRAHELVLEAAARRGERRAQAREVSPSPTSTTRRLIPAARMSSSVTES